MANKENILKLVEALNSGKYVQGRDRLKKPDGQGGYVHCCLGVACEVYIQETGKGQWIDNGTHLHFDAMETARDPYENRSGSVLPKVVSDWYGLNGYKWEHNPRVKVDGLDSPTPVSDLNDELKWSFEKIAEAIKAGYGN
jgi:hypothetical protein